VSYSIAGKVSNGDRRARVIHRTRAVNRNVLLSGVDVEGLEGLARRRIEICAAKHGKHRARFDYLGGSGLVGGRCSDYQIGRAAGIDVADRDGASEFSSGLAEYFHIGRAVCAGEVDNLCCGSNWIQVRSAKHKVSRSAVGTEILRVGTAVGG